MVHAGSGREVCRACCWPWGQWRQHRTASSAARVRWQFLCTPEDVEWFDGPFSSKALLFSSVLTDHDASGNVNTRENKRLRQRLTDSSCWCFPAAGARSPFCGKAPPLPQHKVLLFECNILDCLTVPQRPTGLQTTCYMIIRSHVPEKACCRLPLFIKKFKPHTKGGTRTKKLSWVTSVVH